MKSIVKLSLFACLIAVFSSCVKTDISPVADSQVQNPNPDPAKTNTSPVTNTAPVLGNVNPAITLSGTWSLLNDSTVSTGMGTADHTTKGNYIGQPGDYFTFTDQGKVYIKEGGSIDTANYTLLAGSKIQLNYLYYSGAYVHDYGSIVAAFDVLNLSAHAVTLNSSVVTSGGSYVRIINLKR